MNAARALAAAAAAAAALSLSLPAHAVVTVYTAPLSGAAEAPPNFSLGTGFATVTVNTDTLEMRVEASFSALTGQTTNAHIHCCTALPGEGTAGVATTTPTFPLFPSGVTAGTYDETLSLEDEDTYNPSFITSVAGLDAARAALLSGLADGTAYFNIHTTIFPGGEIRGFLTPVAAIPEPETYLLMLAGLGLIGKIARRRRRA